MMGQQRLQSFELIVIKSLEMQTPMKQQRLTLSQATRLRNQIDDMLIHDYQILNKNEERDESIMSQLDSKNKNSLIMDYVRTIYEDYDLADPLGRNGVRDSQPTTATNKKSKKFISLFTRLDPSFTTPRRMAGRGQRMNTEPSKPPSNEDDFSIPIDDEPINRRPYESGIHQFSISHMKKSKNNKSYFEWNDASMHSSQPNEGIRHTQSIYVGAEVRDQPSIFRYHEAVSPINELKDIEMASETRIEPQQKKLKTIIEQSQIKGSQIDSGLIKKKKSETPEIKAEDLRKKLDQKIEPLKIEEQNKQTIYQSRTITVNYPIQESFRYCIGCECALLSLNIAYHEAHCEAFQRISALPIEEILIYLKSKLLSLRDKLSTLQRNIKPDDAVQMDSSMILVASQTTEISEGGIITNEFQKEYGNVMKIGNRWGILTEQANKIKWFLRVRQHIKEQFNI